MKRLTLILALSLFGCAAQPLSQTEPITLCAPKEVKVGQLFKYKHASGVYVMRVVGIYGPPSLAEGGARVAAAMLLGGGGGGCWDDGPTPVKIRALPVGEAEGTYGGSK
jgi:hypothetical protein